MHEMEYTQHILHAQLPAFGRKVAWTQQIIEDAMAKCEHWSISFSGGVDSTVMLDMIIHAGHHLVAHWADEGWDYPETLTFLAETAHRYSIPLQRFRHMNSWVRWCDEMGRPDLAYDPDALEIWGNPPCWDATWPTLDSRLEYLIGHGYHGSFIGMLAKESRSRRYILSNGKRPTYQVASEHGMWHCSPLAAWDKRDVWAYVVSRNLSYNPVYDRLAELDVPLEHRRVAPLTCYRVMQYGSHTVLKRGWPDLYHRLASHFPLIRSY